MPTRRIPCWTWGGSLGTPGAPTVAVGSAGNVNAGMHSWKVTFVDAMGGATFGGATSAQLNPGVASQITMTAIPTGPTGTVSRSIYRTKAGDTGSYFLVHTIADNTTTSYTDNTADASLGATAAPTTDTSQTYVLSVGYPLDNAVAYPEPREGSEFAQSTGGYEDAWIVGTDQYLEGDVRWIPTSNSSNPTQTGWDGASGFGAFLGWLRNKGVACFYPDSTVAGVSQPVYLVDPVNGAPPIEPTDGTRRIRIKQRTADQSAFTGY